MLLFGACACACVCICVCVYVYMCVLCLRASRPKQSLSPARNDDGVDDAGGDAEKLPQPWPLLRAKKLGSMSMLRHSRTIPGMSESFVFFFLNYLLYCRGVLLFCLLRCIQTIANSNGVQRVFTCPPQIALRPPHTRQTCVFSRNSPPDANTHARVHKGG